MLRHACCHLYGKLFLPALVQCKKAFLRHHTICIDLNHEIWHICELLVTEHMNFIEFSNSDALHTLFYSIRQFGVAVVNVVPEENTDFL